MTDADKGPFVTKTGRVLTDQDIEHLADEAERGYEHLIHKATPALQFVDDASSTCTHCDSGIHKVPGGHGPTWVHTSTGAVAALGAPTFDSIGGSMTNVTEVFILVWQGGDEPPQYEAKATLAEAAAIANEWAEDLEEGVDTIDVLRLDLATLTLTRITEKDLLHP